MIVYADKAQLTKIYDALTLTLADIVVKERNPTTGAVGCKATLHADVSGYGTADQPIEYSVEKTTDGRLYVTLLSSLN